MKVTVMSDLHLEFDRVNNPFHPGEGEVLILAGDICTSVDLLSGGVVGKMYDNFFAECVKNYDKVFYTAGNHESYDGVLSETDKILDSIPGVTYLQNHFEIYNDWMFIGATLWTDFNKFDFEKMSLAIESMNDYRYIYDDASPINPLTTHTIHQNTVNYLSQVIAGSSHKVFVFTHHAPSLVSAINSSRSGSLIHSYASNLEDLIRANKNIKYWAHGHIHESQNYMIDQCNVFSNPRGYCGYGLNPDFNKQMTINL